MYFTNSVTRQLSCPLLHHNPVTRLTYTNYTLDLSIGVAIDASFNISLAPVWKIEIDEILTALQKAPKNNSCTSPQYAIPTRTDDSNINSPACIYITPKVINSYPTFQCSEKNTR
jgi:hypothetical protein